MTGRRLLFDGGLMLSTSSLQETFAVQDVCGCADQNVLFRVRSLPSLIPFPNPKPLSPSGKQVC